MGIGNSALVMVMNFNFILGIAKLAGFCSITLVEVKNDDCFKQTFYLTNSMELKTYTATIQKIFLKNLF
jgi:hypothetical protein